MKCTLCDRDYYTTVHKCPPAWFYVIRESGVPYKEEILAEGKIHALDANDAASTAVEERYDPYNDHECAHGLELEVEIKNADGVDCGTYEVRGEYEPTYWSSHIDPENTSRERDAAIHRARAEEQDVAGQF